MPYRDPMPIHDAPHVRRAFAVFGLVSFRSHGEKVEAFRRIILRARRFGLCTREFEAAIGPLCDCESCRDFKGAIDR